jgi:hypothetical protein
MDLAAIEGTTSTIGHTPKTRHGDENETKKLLDLNLNYSSVHPRPTLASYSSGVALGGQVNSWKPSRVLYTRESGGGGK